MIFFLADLTGTTGLAALLTAVTNTMTFFTTQEACNNRLNTGHSLIRAATRNMTELVAIAALLHTTVERSASISETSEVLFSGSGPFVNQGRALSLVRSEVADCVFLASVTLKVDVCPSLHACGLVVFLHGDHIDVELASAELFLELRVGVIWAGFRENENGFFEVTDVALIAGLLEERPGFIFTLLGDVGVVDCLGVLAVQSDMTCRTDLAMRSWRLWELLTFLLTILAFVNTSRAIIGHVTFLVAVATLALEDTGLGALGLGLSVDVSHIFSMAYQQA